MTYSEKILQFNETLSHVRLDLPNGYRAINPFIGDQRELIGRITTAFYNKYYNDTYSRRLILGSSPARRGSAITGVPFEDAKNLQMEVGVEVDNYYVNRSSSSFIDDVIREYGGRERFYSDFYVNFVCPFSIVKTNTRGNEVNCNYYANKALQEALHSFIIESIRSQINFGLDTTVCYCIGSGDNYNFLSKINNKYNFFDTIIPLEHPRFIMQYNLNHKDVFMAKYLNSLRDGR